MFVRSPFILGRCYLIRTVTHIDIGRLSWIGRQELVMDEASWIADTGRYHEALATGELVEIEPYPGSVIVGRGSIVDACEWLHPLPREPK